MSRTASIYELRDNLADYLKTVFDTETPLIVKRFNKPIVVVYPYKKGMVPDFGKYFGFLGGKESGISFENRIRRSAKEKRHVDLLRIGNG